MKLLLLSIPFLISCSHITYTGKPDGSTIVEGWSIGTQRTLSGVKLTTSKEGRTLSIDKLDSNQVEAIKQINQGLSLLIEGMAKGAK